MKPLTIRILAFFALLLLGHGAALAQSSKVEAKQQTELDALYWNSIKDSNNLSLYEAYVEKFPEGIFVDIAHARINTLKSGGSSTVATTTKPEGESKDEEEWDRPFLKVEHDLQEHF